MRSAKCIDKAQPTLHDGDIVLVDLGRRTPTPPGIFVLHDGMGLVAKRMEHIPNSDPPRVRIISDNPLYKPYDCLGAVAADKSPSACAFAKCCMVAASPSLSSRVVPATAVCASCVRP